MSSKGHQMQINIREIEEKDFSALAALFQDFASFQKMSEHMTNSIEQMSGEQEFLNGFVTTNESGEIIGYATWFYAYFTWVGKSMYMDDLYVQPDYRGQGVGTQLIHKVIENAKAENCKRLRWQVSAWNKPAIGFYESLGAKVDDVESNCDLVLNDI